MTLVLSVAFTPKNTNTRKPAAALPRRRLAGKAVDDIAAGMEDRIGTYGWFP